MQWLELAVRTLTGLPLSAVIAPPKTEQRSSTLRIECIWEIFFLSALQRRPISSHKLLGLPQDHTLLLKARMSNRLAFPRGRRWVQSMRAPSSLGAAAGSPTFMLPASVINRVLKRAGITHGCCSQLACRWVVCFCCLSCTRRGF